MAFKKKPPDNRKIQMVSLIDLIFILLLFFIITSVMVKLTLGESKLYIPTPTNEPGEAQILIQIIDENRYLWLDHTAIDTLYEYSEALPNPKDVRAKIDLLVEKMTLDQDALFARLEELLESSNSSTKKVVPVTLGRVIVWVWKELPPKVSTVPKTFMLSSNTRNIGSLPPKAAPDTETEVRVAGELKSSR